MTSGWQDSTGSHPPGQRPIPHGEPERLYVWLLRRDGTLIATIRQTGERHGVDLALCSLARIIAETGSFALTMAHNHPSGDPRPSSADIAGTRSIWRMARSLDATLLDHLIVGRERSFSFRANGLL
jgi:DNA repair protein RadC